MEKELSEEVITVVVYHNNIHAYNAVYKAICDAAIKQADNYHVKTKVITKL